MLEEAAVQEARIAHLEELLRSASVVAAPSVRDGRAGLGSTVRVRDHLARTREYTLVGHRRPGAEPHEVSVASPVGTALIGARAGDAVEVALPTGRRRRLEILAVEPASPAAAPGPRAA